MKKKLSVIIIAVLAIMIVFAAFGIVTSAESSTIAYTFSNADKGFAEGTITVTAGPDAGGTYYLYWADDRAALEGFDPIGAINVNASSSSTVTMPEYTAIPATATKVIGFKSGSAPANLSVSAASTVYTIPSAKAPGKQKGDVLYTFASYSDFHMCADKTGSSSNYPYDEEHLAAAFKTAADRDVDFIVTTGDHVNNQRHDSNGGNNPFYADEWNTYLKILSQSDYVNPIYEAVGNHELWNYDTESSYSNLDWRTGYNYFITATGLDATASAVNSGKAYYEITEPVTGDHFLFMALEGGFYTDRVNEFTDAQLTWLENKLKQYQNDGKNTFVLEHSNFYKWGSGDQLDNPIYDIPLKDTCTSTVKLKNIIKNYKNAIMITGHTHFKLALQLNYSNNSGTSMTMIHNSSVGAVRDIQNRTTRINDKSLALTEGYIVEVYDDATIFYGTNLYYNKSIPTCSYIVPTATSAINAPTDVPTDIPTDVPTDVPTDIPTDVPTDIPTDAPSDIPSEIPTEIPSEIPTQGPTEDDILYGDVNGDGDVTIIDATYIQRHLAQLIRLTEAEQQRGRVSGAAELGILDATYIQRKLANLITVFPVEEARAELAGVGASVELEAAAADLNTLRTQVSGALSKYYLMASYDQYQALKKAYRNNADYTTLNRAYTDFTAAVTSFYSGDTIDVYFTNNLNWSNVYAYCYSNSTTKNAEWPGQRCTYVTTNSYGQKIYKFSVETGKYNYIIFNNGSSAQTIDLACGITKNQGYYLDGTTDSSGHYRAKQYVYQ